MRATKRDVDAKTHQRARLPERVSAGKEPRLTAEPRTYLNGDDLADALADLPNVLTPRHIQTVLLVSERESYRVAREVGCLRIGRLIRVPRVAFERWLREAWAGADA
jgi:hypothetical protein